MVVRYLEKCQELGIKNVHVHKGPTIWPLNRDAFDVADVDDVATRFPDLNFIVEHVGLPRLEDFCWIGDAGAQRVRRAAVAMPFIHTRPRYFAQIIGELLYWIGEDRHPVRQRLRDLAARSGSSRGSWTSRSRGLRSEYAEVDDRRQAKILGLNAARLYDIEVPEEMRRQERRRQRHGRSERPEASPA